MKIRNGFVSNSSSSSFVVAFPKIPKTSKDILRYMFGGDKKKIFHYEYYGDNGIDYSSQDIANELIRSLPKVIKTPEELVDVTSGRYYYSTSPEYNDNGNPVGIAGWSGKDLKPYFGVNKEKLEKLKKCVIAIEVLEDTYDELLGKRTEKEDDEQEQLLENTQFIIAKLTEEIALEDSVAFMKDNSKASIHLYEYGDSHATVPGHQCLGALIETTPEIWNALPYFCINHH